MADWTTPVTWTTDLALSVARLNEQLRDNQNYLYDLWASMAWGHNLARNGGFYGWLAGSSAAPDGWTLSGTGASVARDGTNYKVGVYAAALTNGAGNSAYLYHQTADDFEGVCLGQKVTLGAWVKCSAASRARLQINFAVGTDVQSPYHSGGGSWEFLHCTATVGASETGIRLELRIEAGAAITVQFDGVILAVGELPSIFTDAPSDNFPRLRWFQNSSGTGYLLGGGLMAQCGESGSSSSNISVTFPASFGAAPILVLCVGTYRNNYSVESAGTTGFTAYKTAGSSSSGVYWLAIGKE
jgi:hypothetical protein